MLIWYTHIQVYSCSIHTIIILDITSLLQVLLLSTNINGYTTCTCINTSCVTLIVLCSHSPSYHTIHVMCIHVHCILPSFYKQVWIKVLRLSIVIRWMDDYIYSDDMLFIMSIIYLTWYSITVYHYYSLLESWVDTICFRVHI